MTRVAETVELILVVFALLVLVSVAVAEIRNDFRRAAAYRRRMNEGTCEDDAARLRELDL